MSSQADGGQRQARAEQLAVSWCNKMEREPSMPAYQLPNRVAINLVLIGIADFNPALMM